MTMPIYREEPKRNSLYTVAYRLNRNGAVWYIDVLAPDKQSAYDIAVYETIPHAEKAMAYSAWVESVTYKNGKKKYFNTHEGKPI